MFSIKIENGKKLFFFDSERLSKEHIEQLKTISLLYEIDNVVYPYDNKNELILKKDRICRFCGKTNPEVSFKNKSHIIPEFLGNSNFLSDFECDSCNSLFSTYESDLANYFGAFLTFAGIKGKKKVPKFKSDSKSVDVELNAPFIDVNFKNSEVFKECIGYDSKNQIQKIQFNSKPFTPLNVFKSFIKISLSTIGEYEKENFTETTDFLLNKRTYKNLESNSFFCVHKYFIPGNFAMKPLIISLRKRKEFDKFPAPTNLSIIQVNNIILQWFIPFHKNDSFILDKKNEKGKKFFLVPPLVPKELITEEGSPFSEFLTFGSDKRLKGIRMTMEYKYVKSKLN
jgi:hypothetical protein